MTSSIRSGGSSRKSRRSETPALFTSRLTAGCVSATQRAIFSTCSRSETSHCSNSAPSSAATRSSRSRPRARSTQRQPRRVSGRAIASPMPLEPPVTTAVFKALELMPLPPAPSTPPDPKSPPHPPPPPPATPDSSPCRSSKASGASSSASPIAARSPGRSRASWPRGGASLAFTYQGERIEKNVRELAESVSSPLITSCDVRSDEDVARVFQETGEAFGGELDILVHSVAFADARDLEGRFTDTRATVSGSPSMSARTRSSPARGPRSR